MRIHAETIELLETQNRRIEDRRADLVAHMWGRDGEEFLLHAKIANNNSTDMPLRMLRYYTDIRFSGQRGPIRQFLTYIGSERLTMPAGLDEPGLLDYRYGLVDMHRFASIGYPQCPGAGVLCDFGDRDPGRRGHLHRAPFTGAVGCE